MLGPLPLVGKLLTSYMDDPIDQVLFSAESFKAPLYTTYYYFAYLHTYRKRAIITRGLYTFYPIFEVQKPLFKELFS